MSTQASSATQESWLARLEGAGWHIDPARQERAEEILRQRRRLGWRARAADQLAVAFYNGPSEPPYEVEVESAASDDGGEMVEVTCSCPDFSKRGDRFRQPCKHVIAACLKADQLNAEDAAVAPEALDVPVQAPAAPASFGEVVKRQIAQANRAWTDLIERWLKLGKTPILVGPTGCGKTEAFYHVATRNGWSLAVLSGSPAFSDPDLVGTHMPDGTRVAGLFGRGFRAARDGQPVLLFLDEFKRLNVRAHDVLAQPLKLVAPEVARSIMVQEDGGHLAPIVVDEPVRIIEAPLWGIEWAPASKAHIGFACNEWGEQVDEAISDRLEPIYVGFSPEVAGLFTGQIRDVITSTWQAAESGELPPLSYRLLVEAEGPDDARIIERYLGRVRLSRGAAAAEGFRTIVTANGLRLPTGWSPINGATA
ncbi:MAG TPA: SWIM zinc finger family protein [Anaerolineae bacterium]